MFLQIFILSLSCSFYLEIGFLKDHSKYLHLEIVSLFKKKGFVLLHDNICACLGFTTLLKLYTIFGR